MRPGPGATACVAGAAAVAFYSPLLFGGALSGHDWASHHYDYFDWVRTSLTEFRTLPLYMVNAWISPNFLANAEAPQLSPLVWLCWWLPTGAYIKTLLVLFTAAGLCGMFQLLRDLRVSAPLAAFAAVAFAFDGFFAAHLSVGHHWAMGALLLPALVCLFRRGVRGSGRALVAAAALNAVAILGGQHQPFVWQNLFLALLAGGWALRDRSPAPLLRFAALVALTLGLGAIKLLPMLAEFADYHPTRRTVGMPPGLLAESLLSRGQHPGLDFSGLAFEHGSGWWEWAFYRGPLGLGALLLGLAAARGHWLFAGVGACFGALALEWPGALAAVDPWPRLVELPVWRTQRSPSRLLFLALFGLSVTSAVGLERLLGFGRRRLAARGLRLGSLDSARLRLAARGLRPLAFVLWSMVVLHGVDLFVESLGWQRAAVGEALVARDPRPKPLAVRAGSAVARLVDFAPNRLVYRVDARRPGTVPLPLRMRAGTREWRVTGGRAHSADGGLAVDVPAGRSELVLTYRPRLLGLGAALSALTLGALTALGLARRAARSAERG